MFRIATTVAMVLALVFISPWNVAHAQGQAETTTNVTSESAQEQKDKSNKTTEEQKAPESAKATHSLGDTVVTASRTEMLKEEVPAVVDVIDSFAIENTADENLPDILKKNTSVDVIDYPGVLSGVSIRGFRPEFDGITKHYLVLTDGRPARSTNIATILKDNIERIEVLKGLASSLYGTEAMGGVINVIAKKSVGKIKTEIEVGGGSFDTHTESASSGGRITPWLDYDVSFMNRNQNDNFKMGNGEEREHTDFAERHGSMRLGSTFLENWRVDTRGNGTWAKTSAAPTPSSMGIHVPYTRMWSATAGISHSRASGAPTSPGGLSSPPTRSPNTPTCTPANPSTRAIWANTTGSGPSSRTPIPSCSTT